MNKVLKEKVMEAFSSVLPITVVVLIASVVLTPMPAGTILMFIAGSALLVIGMGFFTLGADMAMLPLGEGIGVELTRSAKLGVMLLASFIIGIIITVAEPDLYVLARQVPSIEPMVLILTISAGVGFFLALSILRILFRVPLGILLVVFYVMTFAAAWLAPENIVPVGFDSGGVTTGAITVPFILAFGLGVASIRSDKNSQDDSFGIVALCSIGPILTVLLLGMFFRPAGAEADYSPVEMAATSRDVVKAFVRELPVYARDMFIALGMIILFFVVFQLVTRRYKKHQLARMAVGFLYTFIGLVLFLTGVNVGFIPVGQLLGSQLAQSSMKWILIPFGMLTGYFIVAAEPAVHVLNKQVEEISAGAITQKMMRRGLAIGMAAALGLTMTRILLGIPIMWMLVPGYAFSLILTFFVPKLFTGIAFDSGGVCSGPMTTTFLLPLAMGTCVGVGRDLMADAFGIVAMVALTPLIVIQLMGLLYTRKVKAAAGKEGPAVETISAEDAGAIIEFEEEPSHE